MAEPLDLDLPLFDWFNDPKNDPDDETWDDGYRHGLLLMRECRRLRSEIEQRDEMIGALRRYIEKEEARRNTASVDYVGHDALHREVRQLAATIGLRDDGTWIDEGEGANG